MSLIDLNVYNLIAVTLTAAAVWHFEWRSLQDRKSKAVFAVLIITVWTIATAISFFPALPGPPQLLKAIFSPFIRTEL